MKKTLLLFLILVELALAAQSDTLKPVTFTSSNSYFVFNAGMKQPIKSNQSGTSVFTFYTGPTPFLEIGYGRKIEPKIHFQTGIAFSSISNRVTWVGNETISKSEPHFNQRIMFLQVPANLLGWIDTKWDNFNIGGLIGGGLIVYVHATNGIFSDKIYKEYFDYFAIGSSYVNQNTFFNRFRYYLNLGFISEYELGKNSITLKLIYQFNFTDQYNTSVVYHNGLGENHATLIKSVNGIALTLGYKLGLKKKTNFRSQ